MSRATHMLLSQVYALNVASQPLRQAFGGVYHVGSSLERPDYRDVDVRCLLDDATFAALFPGDPEQHRNPRLMLLNAAVSEWLASRTGLPIDFQFQSHTLANAEHQGRRNPLGLSLCPTVEEPHDAESN